MTQPAYKVKRISTPNLHRAYFCLIGMALLGQPAMAQNNQDHKAKNERFTPAQKGTPGYYEQNTRKLFKQGKWAEGKKLLDEGMKQYGSQSALNELMGSYWFHFKQYDKARYYLIRSLRDDQDNLQSKQLLMKIEELTKHFSTAIVYCNELLEAAPYDYGLWKKKIALYRLQGDNVEADRLLQRLSEIYPERTELKKEKLGGFEEKYRYYKGKRNLAGQEEMLRKILEMDPKNADYQMAFCNLLLQTGRTEEALNVAGHAATLVKSPYPFIVKKASILSDMTRYSEALAYLRGIKKSMPGVGSQLTRLINELEVEAARAAAQNDPYTAYARLYAKNHSEEALNYLLNTSITRGYLEDALTYIREARRRRGDTQRLLMSEYNVQRRLGNDKAARSMLERIHNQWPDDQDVSEELFAIRIEEVRRMMDFEQYDEAVTALEALRTFRVDDESKEAVERRIFTCYLKTGQRQKAIQQLERFCKDPQTAAQLYEEIMMPYIKQLMSQGRIRQAETEMQKILDKGYPSADALGLGVNIAMQLKKVEQARSLVELGRRRFPDEPLFMLKYAQLKANDGDYESAMLILLPMLDTFSGDTTVAMAYADCCEQLAMIHLKQKNYDEAMRLIDEALVYNPGSQSLILAKAMTYEGQKEWEKAIEAYLRYRPAANEAREYRLHLETLKRRLMLNQVVVDYQEARPSSEDRISSLASVTYTRIGKENSYTFGLSYAGRDGSTLSDNADETEGGSGVQLSADWQHVWRERPLTTDVILSLANKFFPKIRLEGKGSYELKDDWTAKGSLSYRLVGDNGSASLIGLGGGMTKELAPFSLGADLNLYAMFGKETEYLSGNFFINASVIAKCYPIEGSRTHLFLTGSVGNAPEISLIDNQMPVKFNQLNTMLGFGGLYSANAMLDFGLSGQWYNMSVSSNKSSSNKNYLYLNANVTVHF